jgi:hypothetical protein
MQLKYYVPFKAQVGQEADLALKEKLLNIEGVAIDTSVNSNKWQVPEEDLDFFVSSLQGAQLRIDHAESAMALIGKVPEAKRVGQAALFRAEIGDQAIIEKVIRGYLSHVSVQVDSDDVECSKCNKPSRKEGMLIHLCPGAWEIVHKPKVRELSIVASPAYKNTEFKPVGFAAAMEENQWAAISRSLNHNSESGDVGSRPKEPQGPENKHEKGEVKPLSAQKDGQQTASPHQAQGVVNVAPGEGAPKQVTYDELTNQVVKLMDQLKTAGTDAEIEALNKKVADIEAEVAKRATKTALTRKLTELSKKMSESAADAAEAKSAKKGQGDGDAEEKPPPQAETAESAGHKAPGKGLISNEELDTEQNGPTSPWFKDILKANKQLGAEGHATFSG